MSAAHIENKTKAINDGFKYLELQLDTKNIPFSSDCFGTNRSDLKSSSNFPEFSFSDLNDKFMLYMLLLLLDQHLPSDFRAKLIKAIRPSEIAQLNFFSDKDIERFPNDIETTSICFHALLATNTVTESELASLSQSVYENVNEDGVLHIYSVPNHHRRYNRLDAVSLLNIVRFAYAQRHESLVKPTEDYIFDWLNSGNYKSGTRYYTSAYTFLFYCSMLATTNHQTKIRFMDTLRREFSQLKHEDLKYPLDYAQSILTGTKLGANDEFLVEKLLNMQNEDGSWPADALYLAYDCQIYFGSKSISTMMSVLALIETI